MTRTRFVLAPLVTLALTLGCGGDSSGPPAVATVDVSAASDIAVGQTVQLTATPRDASGTALSGRTVTWSSSNATAATVSNSGVVAGVAAGATTITATIEGKTGTRDITVLPPPVVTVTVTAAQTTLQTGTTTQATAVTRDGAGNVLTGRTVTWATSDPAVASISNSGLVTGLTTGSVTITATSENRTGTVQIAVTSINPADAPQITGVTPATLVEGQTATITGSKFGATAGANVVRIGGVAASVTTATATSLQIVVPQLNCKPAQNIGIEVSVGGAPTAPRTHPFRPSSTFTMTQGQQRLIPNAADFCLQFEATTAPETYLLGVQSVSENVANLTAVNVTGEAASASISSRIPPVIASAPVFGGGVFATRNAQQERLSRHRAVSASLIDQDREFFSRRFASARGNAAARKSARNALGARVPSVGAGAKVGDVINIKVPTRPNTCTLSTPIVTTVKAVGTRAIFLEDNANPTGGFTTADYQALSDRFDSQIYPTDVDYFGEPTDYDANGRIVIVLTKEVNKVPNLLGQVIFADLFPEECPSSNDGEYFYGKAPDPAAAVGTAYTVANALLDAPIIIAHEFAHIIQIGRRWDYEPASAFQSTWELEGQATFAEEINGWTVTGLKPGQNYGFNVAWNDPASSPIAWFQDAFVDLVFYFGAASATAKVPNAPEQCSWLGTSTQGNSGPCVGGRDVYGVPYFFLRYLTDQYGSTFPGGEKAFHRALVENAFTGYSTMSDITGVGIDVLLARWAAALYVDDRVVGIDPRLTFTTWNLADVQSRLVASTHLTPRDRAFGAFTDQVSVRAGSTAYFRVTGEGRSGTGIRVRDLSDGPLPANMRLWVVRIR
jgi:hypothetical protein